jgi:CHAT domain-containing protein
MTRRRDLEIELADRMIKLGKGGKSDAPDVEKLRSAIPPDVALVDLFVVSNELGWKALAPPGSRMVAFVIRRDRPVVRVDLGPMGLIEANIDGWRKVAAEGVDPLAGNARNMTLQFATRIWYQVWSPLKPYLGGIHSVLVSPDGPLCRFPIAALPGTAASSYLIEEMGVATIPVPWKLASGTPLPTSAGRLLLVGDIDFGADPGPTNSERESGPGALAQRRVGQKVFPPLRGTLREVEAIQARFLATHPGGEVRLLRGGDATERAFLSSLTGSRFVHLATHGYFDASPLVDRPLGSEGDLWRSPLLLARQNPSMLSGIAFAGANHPFRPGREDGILTALEALQLDLSGAEIVVLSACESTLGTRTQGEGLIGLQRAFHVAGARSLISSLWQVDDAATAAFMEEFYANLWERRLPRIEALRQAQVALLRRYDPRTQKMRRDGQPDGPETSAAAPVRGDQTTPQGLPPCFWAAFVLSGDWR